MKLTPTRILAVYCWTLVACVVFCLAFFPLRSSSDEWWHLKTGQWIVEHNYQLPTNDIFSYTSADYEWDNHEWLIETGMYLLYRWGEAHEIGGWSLIILVKAFLVTATFLLLGCFLSQRAGGGKRGFWIGIFLTLIAASVGKRMFWPRPPVVSVFFMVVFLYVMWQHRAGRLKTRHLLVLPALMPLWANLHGGFIVGGLIIAAYFGGELIEYLGLLWKNRNAKKSTDDLEAKKFRVLVYLALGIIVGIGSLATPYGYKLYLLSGRVMKSKELVSRLDEMLPPKFQFTWGYDFLLALIAIGFVVLVIRTFRRKSTPWPPLAEILLVVFFAHQSLSHVRHLILFGVAASPVAAWMLREWWGDAEGNAIRRSRIFGSALGGTSLVCALWLVLLPCEGIALFQALPTLCTQPERVHFGPSPLQRSGQLLSGKSEDENEYPRQAVAFILRTMPPGHMYNRDYLCGYLIWALSPEKYQTFTDNRFDIFGDEFLMDQLSVANAWPEGFLQPYGTPVRDWHTVIEAWEINWLFIEKSELIHGKLKRGEDKGWFQVYEDQQYAIWMKDTPENQEWWKQRKK